MSQGGQENQGAGLRDVFNILVNAPLERLLSLTFQLRESPEDNIIHALCLIVLQREAQGLNKLQTVRDNYLAKHLAEKWQISGGKLEDFASHCGNFQDCTWESLVLLARIFKVLSEQRLCDPFVRNLAYKRALSIEDHKRSSNKDMEYGHLREEAKMVCGPQVAEFMCSSTDLKSGSGHYLHSSLDKGNTTLKGTLSQEQSGIAYCLPSPLLTSSSTLSYPTHLEISIAPTASLQDSRRTPEASDKSNSNTSIIDEFEARNSPPPSQTCVEPRVKSNHPPLFIAEKHTRMDETVSAEGNKFDSLHSPTKTTTSVTESNSALPTATNMLPKKHIANEVDESNSAEEDEEDMFYAFVILHAPEDADMAEIMRGKLESVISSPGATFSDDFAIPGKSTLRCLEDAINNTAFTLLLLTRNFNTRMLDMETDSALINSLNKKHKYNTVIPLLPRKNCMPKKSIPFVLQTIIPLEENKSFEKKILKSLSQARIKRQKKIWIEEQKLKIQIQRQERLKQLKQHKKQLIKECETAQLLERENLRLIMTQKLLLCPSASLEQDGGDDRAWWQQQPNIHIENAKYIMIGNDSQMTVDLGVGENKDNVMNREEDQ